MKLINAEVIEEVPYGVYVCLCEGKYLVNENYDYLCIMAIKGDQSKINNLKDVARSYGFPDVEVEFRSGARMISEEEYEEQMDRMKNGLVPDKYDIATIQAELEAKKLGL